MELRRLIKGGLTICSGCERMHLIKGGLTICSGCELMHLIKGGQTISGAHARRWLARIYISATVAAVQLHYSATIANNEHSKDNDHSCYNMSHVIRHQSYNTFLVV